MNKQDELIERFLDKLQGLTCTQVNAALMYSQLMTHINLNNNVWAIINRAIVDKWPRGLVRIKTMAWQLHKNDHLTLE